MIEAFYIGVTGLLLLLIAFLLNLFRNFSPNSKIYLLLNLLGSGFLTYYAYISDVFIFLVLNALWALISIYKLVRVFKGKI